MNDDGIVFQSRIDKIVADAADIADPLDPLPVLHDTHLAAHAVFFHDLIENIDGIESVLRLRLLVDRIHKGKRTLVSQICVDPLIRQKASNQSLCRCLILGGGFCGFLRLLGLLFLGLLRGNIGIVLRYLFGNGESLFRFFLLLAAASHQAESSQKSKSQDQFLFHNSLRLILLVIHRCQYDLICAAVPAFRFRKHRIRGP